MKKRFFLLFTSLNGLLFFCYGNSLEGDLSLLSIVESNSQAIFTAEPYQNRGFQADPFASIISIFSFKIGNNEKKIECINRTFESIEIQLYNFIKPVHDLNGNYSAQEVVFFPLRI